MKDQRLDLILFRSGMVSLRGEMEKRLCILPEFLVGMCSATKTKEDEVYKSEELGKIGQNTDPDATRQDQTGPTYEPPCKLA